MGIPTVVMLTVFVPLVLARRYSQPPANAFVVATRCPNTNPLLWTQSYIESKDVALVSCCKTGQTPFRKVQKACAGEVTHTEAIEFCSQGGTLFSVPEIMIISVMSINYMSATFSHQVDGCVTLPNSNQLVNWVVKVIVCSDGLRFPQVRAQIPT